METVERPDLHEQAFEILSALNWHGPAQVEFLDDTDGRAHLIEINGRFWGNLDGAIQAGMNFPYLASLLAAGEDVPEQRDYEIGTQFRWPFPFALLDALTSERKAGTLWEWLKPRANVRSDLLLSDSAPHLAEALFHARRMLNRPF